MLGERIKMLRQEVSGLTQSKLSLELGFGKSTIGMIESGKRNASQEAIEKIADYFNVSVDFLLGRTEIRNDKVKLNREKIIDDFIDNLIDEKIITDPNNIDNETKDMIINAVKAHVALKMKKKNS